MKLLTILLAESVTKGGGLQTILMFGLIFVVFYLFMIRPQMKKQKEQKKFRESLEKGTKIVTIGGVHGKIVGIQDNTAIIEVEGGNKLKIEKSAIAKEFSAEELEKK